MSLVQISNASSRKPALDQLAQTPDFNNWLDGKPEAAAEAQELDSNSRRDILKIMAAGAGLAGLVSCRRPEQKIVSFSRGVEDLIPGKSLYYNTVYNLNGVAQGLRIEASDGRPTKVEGNPVHPASKGAANTWSQGSILNLYDPDRCGSPMKDGVSTTWEEFAKFAKDFAAKSGDGSGVAVIAERNAGPSWRALVATAAKKWPKAQWVDYAAVNHDNVIEGAKLATGTPAQPLFAFDKAEVVLSLDYDFLGIDATSVLDTKLFSSKRKVSKPGDEMNRLYVVEGLYSLTGGMADNRLRLKPSEVPGFAKEVLDLVGQADIKIEGEGRKKFAAAVASDLKKNAGKSIVAAGPRQAPEVHALALAINQVLGNIGSTVTLVQPLFETQAAKLKTLADSLKAGQISTLIILGSNPAYTMPADFDFASSAKKAKTIIHLGPDMDETAALANWCLPEAHYLEAWADGRSLDGTISVQQPVIAPLNGGKTAAEVVSMLAGAEARGFDIVKSNLIAGLPGDKEKAWRKILHDGIVEGSAFPALKLTVDPKKVAALPLPAASTSEELVFTLANGVHDGRFANNAWLVELPDPLTKVVWDNCITMSKATAKKLGVNMGFIGLEGDVVTVSINGTSVELPVVVMPGQADGVFGVSLGYGREKVGRVGKGAGVNAYKLRNSTALNYVAGVSVTKAAKTFLLVRTQDDPEGDTQHGRPIVREATLEEFTKEPKFAQEVEGPPLKSLFDDWDYSGGYQWGMTIDLNQCTGCNACLVACFSENNIPMVGKKMVAMGREMHWIRLDRYYVGDGDEPQVAVQPLNCQQCENAPCESVCPVAATVHSPEGLNDMAYNRCIGTRYCMNNCPYKVRKFNYLNWNKSKTEVESLASNPDVSVRMRGVMEKCTYCTQRIAEGKINAKTDPAGRRPVKDLEIKTACQQTCPADAIVFGNINDPNSVVSKMKAQTRNYALLAELNIRPRTTYLAKLRNPHPALAGESKHGEASHGAAAHAAGSEKAAEKGAAH